MKNHVQTGRVQTYVTPALLVSGQVVAIGQTLGVATADAAAGAETEVAMEGVYNCPKVTGAVIAQGESLTWDVSAGKFDDNLATPATGDITGPPAVAWEASGNGATSLMVKFTGVPGTKT